MKDIMAGVFVLTIVVLIAAPWLWNAAKFANCDFESNYRCEAIHGIGIIMPPASYVTVWFDDDKDD